MTCYDAKEKISMHLNDAHADADVAEHLATCPACVLMLESLKKVDQAFKTEFILTEPPPHYWENLPRIISQKLAAQKPPAIFDKWLNAIQKAFAPVSVRWGLAGAAAVLAVMFFWRSFISLNKEMTKADAPPSQLSTQANAEIAKSKSNDAKPTILAMEKAEAAPSSPTQAVQAPAPSNAIAGNIRNLPVRAEPVKPMHGKKVLYPTTSLNTDSFVQAAEENEEEATNWRVFALTLNSHSRGPAATPRGDSQVEDAQSSFSQTLWIVQQGTSLEEKRNIWLSYITREKDATYRALGIYNLALTLAKMVEESKSPEKAKEALRFYREHEELLKVQMGEERYLLKVSAFESLIQN
jgi:hypothetical protein